MTATRFSLTRDEMDALERYGLRLGGLAGVTHLAEGSRIETPSSVLAAVAPGAFLDIGAFCNLSGGSINELRAGRYCSIAQGVVIGAHEHPTDWLSTSRTGYYPQVNGWDRLMAGAEAPVIRAKTRPYAGSCPLTTLGPDVWVGQGAFIKAGVTIGAGAIVGARATVLRNVPPYAIVVGTPARVLRLRFPERTVERLLALEWWRYSIYDLFDAPFDRIEQALDVIEAKVAAGEVLPFRGREIRPADLAAPGVLLAALGADAIRAAS